MCSELLIPGDFDVARISWRPDYDPFFYRQLSRRARRIYLFRDEYIFDVEKAVVVEPPQLGHATYVFAKPRAWTVFFPCTPRSLKTTFGETATMPANFWAFVRTRCCVQSKCDR